MRLFDSRKTLYDFKKHMLGLGSESGVKYLNRMLRRGPMGSSWSATRSIRGRCWGSGIADCTWKDTPMTKEGWVDLVGGSKRVRREGGSRYQLYGSGLARVGPNEWPFPAEVPRQHVFEDGKPALGIAAERGDDASSR